MKTLFPYKETPTDGLDEWPGGPPYGRFVLEIETELDDEWQHVVLPDGRSAWVRKADCGAGCRCAGEFTLVAP